MMKENQKNKDLAIGQLLKPLRYGQLGILVAKGQRSSGLRGAMLSRRYGSVIQGMALPKHYRHFSALGFQMVEIEADLTAFPELEGAVALRRPLVGNPLPEAFIVAQAQGSRWNIVSADYVLLQIRELLGEVIDFEAPLVHWIRIGPWPQENVGSSPGEGPEDHIGESERKVPEFRFRMLSRAEREGKEFPCESCPEEDELPADGGRQEPEPQESLEAQKKEWMDRLSAMVLEYVTKFQEMPSATMVNELLRGRLSLQTNGLSRVRVTGDMRVVLPDYNEIELRIPPLARSLYILFLRHPEGIRLKALSDYQSELEELYNMTMPGRDEAIAPELVAELCAPGSDSLRQKLSIIKRTINAQILNLSLASHYLIAGTRGNLYRIAVPSELISIAF